MLSVASYTTDFFIYAFWGASFRENAVQLWTRITRNESGEFRLSKRTILSKLSRQSHSSGSGSSHLPATTFHQSNNIYRPPQVERRDDPATLTAAKRVELNYSTLDTEASNAAVATVDINRLELNRPHGCRIDSAVNGIHPGRRTTTINEYTDNVASPHVDKL